MNYATKLVYCIYTYAIELIFFFEVQNYSFLASSVYVGMRKTRRLRLVFRLVFSTRGFRRVVFNEFSYIRLCLLKDFTWLFTYEG